MADRKIILHKHNGTGYDNLYPKTTVDQVDGLSTELTGKETTSNKVTSISSSSTDIQYPSAKVVYDNISTKATVIVSKEQPTSINTGDWWYEREPYPIETPLNFTANTAGSTITLVNNDAPWAGSYSTDGAIWTTYASGTQITLTNTGDKVYFKGDISGNFSDSNYLQFTMTGSIAASGNCNSIYKSTDFKNLNTLTYTYCYYYLFYNCTALTTAPILPATILSESCYACMFRGCTALVSTPSLPAATIPQYGYTSMFLGCTSLTTIPILPATTLNNRSYAYMFNGCTSLQISDTQTSSAAYILRIPNADTFTITANQYGMFEGCLGTRSSDDMAGAQGQSYTYYTQNQPI